MKLLPHLPTCSLTPLQFLGLDDDEGSPSDGPERTNPSEENMSILFEPGADEWRRTAGSPTALLLGGPPDNGLMWPSSSSPRQNVPILTASVSYPLLPPFLSAGLASAFGSVVGDTLDVAAGSSTTHNTASCSSVQQKPVHEWQRGIETLEPAACLGVQQAGFSVVAGQQTTPLSRVQTTSLHVAAAQAGHGQLLQPGEPATAAAPAFHTSDGRDAPESPKGGEEGPGFCPLPETCGPPAGQARRGSSSPQHTPWVRSGCV